MACLVPNCSGGKNLLRHTLPKNNKLRQDWLLALNREDLIGKQHREVYTLKVCSKHFAPSSYRTKEGVCLNTNAMPIPVPKDAEKKSKMNKYEPSYKCIVAGCDPAANARMHRLPRRKALRDAWLKNLEREDLKDNSLLSLKNKCVCGAHFDESSYTYPGGKILRNTMPRPINQIKIETVEPDEPEFPIEDEIVAKGEVTAPLLCDNKVLLKTKSTYSKNKYEMTYKNTDPLPTIAGDNIPNTDDTRDSSEFEDNPHEIPTSTKKRKLSETFTEEISQIEENKYDDKLLSFLQELGSLPKFLDVIFGFLYRRTDYYEVESETNPGIGLPEGVAQKLLWQAFKKYETPKIEIIEEPLEIKPIIEESKPFIEESEPFIEESKPIIQESKPTKDNKNDMRIFKTYNGAVYDNYAWSQTTKDLDIQIKIPDKITCKQLQIDITATDLLIKQRNTDLVYLKGELCKECKENEAVWSLGGNILQIHLEKNVQNWWDCLLKTEPRLDFNKMNNLKVIKLEDVLKGRV